MALQRVLALLQTCTTDTPLFPPKTLYNERWLLRLLLNWFSAFDLPDHPLHFPAGARWYAQGMLPTPFSKRYADDRLAEDGSEADGALGHFELADDPGQPQIVLKRDAGHLVILAARMFDPLKPGIKRAAYFNQAARTVTCIAEALRRADRFPLDMDRVGFYVVAPRTQIEQGIFVEDLNRDELQRTVKQRVREYKGSDAYPDKKSWYKEWLKPTVQQIDLQTLSWEDLIATVGQHDRAEATALGAFYNRCVEFG
jgi:hypothetical protein